MTHIALALRDRALSRLAADGYWAPPSNASNINPRCAVAQVRDFLLAYYAPWRWTPGWRPKNIHDVKLAAVVMWPRPVDRLTVWEHEKEIAMVEWHPDGASVANARVTRPRRARELLELLRPGARRGRPRRPSLRACAAPE